ESAGKSMDAGVAPQECLGGRIGRVRAVLSEAREHDLVVPAGNRREALLGEASRHGEILGARNVPAVEIAGSANVDEDRAAAIVDEGGAGGMVEGLGRLGLDRGGAPYDVLVLLPDDQPLVVGIGQIRPGPLGNAGPA